MNWHKPFGGRMSASRKHITFNEGAGPFNFYIGWGGKYIALFCYGYFLGKRGSFQITRKVPKTHG